MHKRPELKPKDTLAGALAETVDAILQATALLLNDRGYDALTTNRIAVRAGVNIATLYQYFPNKQAIFAELQRRHVAQARAAALESFSRPAAPGFAGAIRAVVDACIAAHKVEPRLHQIFVREAPRLGIGSAMSAIDAPSDVAIRALSAQWCDSVRGQFDNPELVLWIAGSALHALLHLALVERPTDFGQPQFAEELTRLLVSYLRPRVSLA